MLQRPRLIAAAIAALLPFLPPGPARGQETARGILERLGRKADQVGADMNRDLGEEAARIQEQRGRLDELLGLADGMAMANANAYREAVEKFEAAVAVQERAPDGERTANWEHLHVDTLLELGRLYAVMGERARGLAMAERAAKALRRLDGKASNFEPLRIQGRVRLGLQWLALERPLAAVRETQEALTRCSRYAAQESSGRLGLLATCRLARATVARAVGDPAALGQAREALPILRVVGDPGEVAAALQIIGEERLGQGEGGEALRALQEAVGLLERRFPLGSPARAAAALTLASCYQQRGETEAAVGEVERARAMWANLFPEAGFPKGHPGHILALDSLGDALQRLDQADLSLKFHRESWRMAQEYYAGQDHEIKLRSLLGYVHDLRVARASGQPAAGLESMVGNAVAMAGRLHHPAGPPHLATARFEAGLVQGLAGHPDLALAEFEAARALLAARYPGGHQQIAQLDEQSGVMHHRLGHPDRAADLIRDALELDQRLTLEAMRGAPDSEALALSGRPRVGYHAMLVVSRERPQADQDRAYQAVWMAKGAVTRMLADRRAGRRLALGVAGPDAASRLRPREAAELKHAWDELRQVNARLGSLLLDRWDDPAERDAALIGLATRREDLQRELVRRVPAYRRQEERNHLGPDDLARRLPAGSVFVDYVRYDDHLTATRPASRYAAFVLAPGGKPVRAELGDAAPIDAAVKLWRESVTRWLPTLTRDLRAQIEATNRAQGLLLRRLAWERVAAHFPPGTTHVYLGLDGELAKIPFVAIPGPDPGSALVDQYIIARVSHGPALLDDLDRPTPPKTPGAFLALGDVDYDPPHARLPGSVEAIRFAERVAAQRPTIILRGRQATPDALCRALPGAGDAVIETHAFFDARFFEEGRKRRANLAREVFRIETPTIRRGMPLALQSPLVSTGLVLTRERPTDEHAAELSGEAIAELSLEGLRSVFLPDCDTGVGESLPVEGVQSLQEAFHLAGCPNVIASLWPVPDLPTQALVARYHAHLATGKYLTAEALCLAQRDLFRDPRLAGAPVDGSGRPPRRSHPTLWAGMVHSGAGR